MLFAKKTAWIAAQRSHGSEVATLNQRKTADSSFLRIEFEGWFVVANTRGPRVTASLTTWTEQ